MLVVSIWDDHKPHDVAAATGTYDDGRFVVRHWRLLSAGAGHFAASAFTDVEGRSCLIFWIRGITDPGRIRARKVKVRVKEAHHTYSTRTSSVIRAQRASTSSRFSPKTMA